MFQKRQTANLNSYLPGTNRFQVLWHTANQLLSFLSFFNQRQIDRRRFHHGSVRGEDKKTFLRCMCGGLIKNSTLRVFLGPCALLTLSSNCLSAIDVRHLSFISKKLLVHDVGQNISFVSCTIIRNINVLSLPLEVE